MLRKTLRAFSEAACAAFSQGISYRTGTPLSTQQDSRTIRSVCKMMRLGLELALPVIRSRSS
jgi:hypothetical protein